MDFRAFEATPGSSVVVLPDTPHFTIVAVSDDYVAASGRRKDELIGKGLFDVFPKNPADVNFTGVQNLLSSFEYILQNKCRHSIPRHRYDIAGEDGAFSQKYWQVHNAPILNDAGEVSYIIHTAIDITDKVIAQQKADSAKGIEKSYRFFMNAPVIIGYLKGSNYTIELANEGLLEVWGRTSDVVGKPLLVAIPELEAQGFIPLLDKVRTTGEPFYAYEYPIVLVRDGKEETLYFDFVYKPYYETATDEIANGVISVGHDVTRQVLAKEKIAESEAKYRTLFESMDQGFCVLEMIFDENNYPLDYRFEEINPVFEEQTGLKDAIGKTARQLVPQLEQHWFDLYGKVALTGESTRFIEGSEAMGRWFEVYAFRMGGAESRKVALLFTDITERRIAEKSISESNERFRNLADDSPMFVFIIDPEPEAPVSYWNKTWLSYTGQSIQEALGRAWGVFIHPDDIPIVMEYYTPAFQSRQSYFIPAVRVKRHDGVYRWHAFKGNVRYGADGSFNGYVGVGFDIHDQKLTEEALKQSEVQLQQKVTERTFELQRLVEDLRKSNSNLEEFAYAASHDLKEPIRKIHLFGERIKEGMADRMSADEKRYFERMESATRRMSNLIDDLLSYSQISIRPKVFEAVNLNNLLDMVLEDLDLEIEDKNAVVVVEELFTFQGHQRQLQQAFQNLVSNALKYSRQGVPPEIRIYYRKMKGSETSLHLSFDDQQKLFYCITIADNGIGFEQADAERIFNVFTRLHGLAEYKGTGIGLSIVRKVIENHNGHIWAEAKPGAGAAFHILLPADVKGN